MFTTVLLIYSLISGAILSLLWVVFRLAGINRLTCHSLNRGLLVAILIVSIGLPFIAFFEPDAKGVPADIEAVEMTKIVEVVDMTGVDGAAEPSFWDRVVSVLPTIYIIGFVVSIGWLLIALTGVALAIIRGEKRRIDRHTTIVIHSRNITPFTWGRWIVISRSDLETNAEMLLAHENAHKVAVHWLDLLIGRLVACVDWYWPSAWLLIRDLSAVHEYQADRLVVGGGNDAAAYQMLLIRKGASGVFFNITNPFNNNSLKNRITMMQKKQSSTRSRMRCLVMLPAAVVAVLFSTAPALASAVKSALPASIESCTSFEESLKTLDDGLIMAEQPGEEVCDELAVSLPDEIAAEPASVQKTAATFPGGDEAMFKYLSQNIHYPEQAHQNNIQGRVLVQFLVQKDGSITDIKVIDAIDPLLDAEAIRVVESMPKFIPATENGDAVAEWFTLPINFKLESEDSHRVYVLDGKIVSADEIRNLDKNTIDGVNVLTGDRAKEIYGNDAADGAVIVQTKAFAAEQAKLDQNVAKFPGGDAAMYQFLARNIRYPEEAAKKDIQGRVIVQFKVQKDGSITDARVARGVDPLLDAEAVRVIESMPKFEPATENGEPVAVWQTMPISFKLSSKGIKSLKK